MRSAIAPTNLCSARTLQGNDYRTPRPATSLAFHHLVALLHQPLPLAILALLLLLDVGAFFIGHDVLRR